jgi:2-keto-4-pentenoate hydratase/2-oxohepta-3-ene-1,7-dioic acid hydratase in catechol pathway
VGYKQNEIQRRYLMKLATYIHDQQERVGAVVDGSIFDLAAALQASGKGDPAQAASMLALLAAGPRALDEANAALTWAQAYGGQFAHPLDQVKLRAPIPCPGKLLCLAGNYASHLLEGGGTFPGKEKMSPVSSANPALRLWAHRMPSAFPPPLVLPIGSWNWRW